MMDAGCSSGRRPGGWRTPAVAGMAAVLVGMPVGMPGLAAPAAARTQARMNVDAAAAYRSADAAMNAQWQRTGAAMRHRDAAAKDGFGYVAATLASQRAWLAFRDRQCVIEGGEFAGGSLQPMARLQCMTRLTRERTVQLKGLMWQR